MTRRLEQDVKRVVDREGLQALMLSVEYNGPATLIELRSTPHSAFSRFEFNIGIYGTHRIPVVFPHIPDDIDRPAGILSDLIKFFAVSGMRGLNIPETNALAKYFAGTPNASKIFRGIGQTVRGAFDEQIPYAAHGGIGLFPVQRVTKEDLIPATWAPDPLMRRLPAPC